MFRGLHCFREGMMHPVANSATLSCHRPHGASGRTAGWSLAAMQHCSAHTAHAQRLAGSFQLDRCATCAAVPHGCNNSSSSTGSSGQQAKNPGTSSTGSSRQAPWAFAAYYTKKLERRTDALGNIVQDSSTIAEPLNWTADARLALAVKVVAGEFGVGEEVVRERVDLLRGVLPDGKLESPGAKVADLVRVAMDVDGVVAKLLLLREEFPRANVSAVVSKHPNLLGIPLDDFSSSAREFRRLLLEQGGDDPDALVQEAPLLLEPGVLSNVLDELRRLFGSKTPPGRLLQNAPGLALSCQSLQSQSRGERDYEYLKNIFSGGGGLTAVSSSSI